MIKSTVAACWTVAVCLAGTTAWAAAKPAAPAAALKAAEIKGTIHGVDMVNDVVVLEGGVFYMIPAAIKLDDFKAGDQVTIALVDGDAHAVKTIAKSN